MTSCNPNVQCIWHKMNKKFTNHEFINVKLVFNKTTGYIAVYNSSVLYLLQSRLHKSSNIFSICLYYLENPRFSLVTGYTRIYRVLPTRLQQQQLCLIENETKNSFNFQFQFQIRISNSISN